MPPRWVLYAVAAAACAAVIPVLARKGLRDVDPLLASGLRSVVMMLALVVACSAAGRWAAVGGADRTALLMIVLSGVAGAASWLLGFHALALADASKVMPLDKLSVPLAAILAVLWLGERPAAENWVGIALISVGAYLAAK